MKRTSTTRRLGARRWALLLVLGAIAISLDGLPGYASAQTPVRAVSHARGSKAPVTGRVPRANPDTALFNSAMIMFREGLEAILILAAVTASFVGARAVQRRPVYAGAGASVAAMIVTWVLAGALLSFFSQYGERLQAVTSLVAVLLLLVILNWFLHRIYWTGWISKHHRRRRELTLGSGRGLISSQTMGLLALGFTSVYREGLEVVLFCQSLRLRSGAGPVLTGLAIGGAGVLAVGVLTFALHRRLPYRRMLIFTGVMIALVLVIMVGGTAHTMQEVGWLGNTPVDLHLPGWLATWLEIRPSYQALLAQAAALLTVVGSYVAAEALHGRGPLGRASRRGSENALPNQA